MIDWHRLPGKKALSLILISAASNSSTKLTAGKLVELSLSSFCSVSGRFIFHIKLYKLYFILLFSVTGVKIIFSIFKFTSYSYYINISRCDNKKFIKIQNNYFKILLKLIFFSHRKFNLFKKLYSLEKLQNKQFEK